MYLAIAIVPVFGILLGFSDVGLASYNLVSNVAGETKLVSYIDEPVAPVGWTNRFESTYTWAAPLFGEGSTWNRYLLSPSTGVICTPRPIVADVIDSPDLGPSLRTVSSSATSSTDIRWQTWRRSLGGGITGQTLAYKSQQYGSWSIVYWILPVERGASTVYERVVLYVQNQHGVIAAATVGDQTAIRHQAGVLGSNNPHQVVLLQNQDFLEAYAREMISDQARQSAAVFADHAAA